MRIAVLGGGLLQQRAAEAGVDVRFSTPVDPDQLLADGYDASVMSTL